jgi:hypothetical protein
MNQGPTVIVVGFSFYCKSLLPYLGHPDVLSVSATAVTALEAAPFVLVRSKHNGLCSTLKRKFRKSTVQQVSSATEVSEWLEELISTAKTAPTSSTPTEPPKPAATATPNTTTPSKSKETNAPLSDELRRTLKQVEMAMNGVFPPTERSYTGSSLGRVLRPPTVHKASEIDNLCTSIEASGSVVEFLPVSGRPPNP